MSRVSRRQSKIAVAQSKDNREAALEALNSRTRLGGRQRAVHKAEKALEKAKRLSNVATLDQIKSEVESGKAKKWEHEWGKKTGRKKIDRNYPLSPALPDYHTQIKGTSETALETVGLLEEVRLRNRRHTVYSSGISKDRPLSHTSDSGSHSSSLSIPPGRRERPSREEMHRDFRNFFPDSPNAASTSSVSAGGLSMQSSDSFDGCSDARQGLGRGETSSDSGIARDLSRPADSCPDEMVMPEGGNSGLEKAPQMSVHIAPDGVATLEPFSRVTTASPLVRSPSGHVETKDEDTLGSRQKNWASAPHVNIISGCEPSRSPSTAHESSPSAEREAISLSSGSMPIIPRPSFTRIGATSITAASPADIEIRHAPNLNHSLLDNDEGPLRTDNAGTPTLGSEPNPSQSSPTLGSHPSPSTHPGPFGDNGVASPASRQSGSLQEPKRLQSDASVLSRSTTPKAWRSSDALAPRPTRSSSFSQIRKPPAPLALVPTGVSSPLIGNKSPSSPKIRPLKHKADAGANLVAQTRAIGLHGGGGVSCPGKVGVGLGATDTATNLMNGLSITSSSQARHSASSTSPHRMRKGMVGAVRLPASHPASTRHASMRPAAVNVNGLRTVPLASPDSMSSSSPSGADRRVIYSPSAAQDCASTPLKRPPRRQPGDVRPEAHGAQPPTIASDE